MRYGGTCEPWIALLGDVSNSVAPADLLTLERTAVDGPGLYAWFADAQGALDLSAGLGHEVPPGLIYVGQTGATKWPSGTASGSTLLKRIRAQHLGGNRRSSTLRRTLGAVLDSARGSSVGREDLTAWMFAHLRVVPAIVSEPGGIADLERQVVEALDPPLNLDHTQPTPLRRTLRALRSSAATLP